MAIVYSVYPTSAVPLKKMKEENTEGCERMYFVPNIIEHYVMKVYHIPCEFLSHYYPCENL